MVRLFAYLYFKSVCFEGKFFNFCQFRSLKENIKTSTHSREYCDDEMKQTHRSSLCLEQHMTSIE